MDPFTTEGAKRIAQIAGQATAPISASVMSNPAPALTMPQPVIPALPAIPSLDTILAYEPTAAETRQNELLNTVSDRTDDLAQEESFRVSQEQLAGVDEKKKTIRDLTTQFNTLNAEADAAITRAEDRPIGLGFIRGEQGQIDRQRSIRQLGISASLNAANGNLASAMDQVETAVRAKFAPIRAEIEATKAQLAALEPTLSREDKRRAEQVSVQLAERERLLAEQEAEQNAIYETMVTAASLGADAVTVRKIMNATTKEAAVEAAGSVLGAEFKAQQDQRAFENKLAIRNMALNEAQLQLAKNKFAFERQQIEADTEAGILSDADIKNIDNSPQGKKVKTLGDLKLKTAAYQELVKQYGTSSFGAQKAKLDASFADLKIAYKTAAELGALQGPDIALLEEALRPATFGNPLTQAFAKLTGRGTGAISASLDQAISVIESSGETNVTQLLARNPKYANSNYVQSLALPFMKADSTTVQIGNQTVPVGSIIENEQGQRGRVNADGTITPL